MRQIMINEISRQPEPLLREVWNYLSFLKSQADNEPADDVAVRPGFGSVPGIRLADDFDAPLSDFAEYRP